MRYLVAALVVAIAHPALADDAEDFVAQGEALGKQGEWSRAIDAFKQADAHHPRAKHACLIGLAYTRKEAWAQAELFLSICRQRATADDPAPDWLPDAEKTLAEKLATSNAAPVTIAVTPANALPLVTVSSFAPDEKFAPRTIHLPPGTYTLTATAPGYPPAKREIAITSHAPQTIEIALATPPAPRGPSKLPLVAMIAGGVLLAAGSVYDVSVVQPIRDRLTSHTVEYYDVHKSELSGPQLATIGLFASGAALAVAGVVLRYTVFRHRDVRVGALTLRGGAGLALEWQR